MVDLALSLITFGQYLPLCSAQLVAFMAGSLWRRHILISLMPAQNVLFLHYLRSPVVIAFMLSAILAAGGNTALTILFRCLWSCAIIPRMIGGSGRVLSLKS